MIKFMKWQWPCLGLFLILFTVAFFMFIKRQKIPFILSQLVPELVAETPILIKGWQTVFWFPGDQYEYGISNEVFYKKHNCAFIWSSTDEPFMFGELFQTFNAKQYRNK